MGLLIGSFNGLFHLQIAEAGSTVRLNCTSSDPGATLRWAHDGAALAGAGAGAGAGGMLVLRGVSRAHAGVYQCLARRGTRTEQAAVEIRLGGWLLLSIYSCKHALYNLKD